MEELISLLEEKVSLLEEKDARIEKLHRVVIDLTDQNKKLKSVNLSLLTRKKCLPDPLDIEEPPVVSIPNEV